MPVWWVEIAQLFSTYGFWFMLSAVFIGIIIQYLIRPWLSKLGERVQKVSCQTEILYDSSLYENKKDKRGYRLPVTREEMLAEMETIREKLETIRVTVSDIKCPNTECPIVSQCKMFSLEEEKQREVFLGKLLELSRETQEDFEANAERTKALYQRIHQFMDETLTKREAALDKRDEMLSKAMASLERLAVKRDNGEK